MTHESQLRDYQASLGKPFQHDDYLPELTGLRDQLKAGLSGASQEPGKQEGPSVSDLSEQIKAIKAANTIEATPQRDRQKNSAAEEPITARIRGRTEAFPTLDRVKEADAAPEAEAVRSQGSMENSTLDSLRTFQDRVILERMRNDDWPTPP